MEHKDKTIKLMLVCRSLPLHEMQVKSVEFLTSLSRNLSLNDLWVLQSDNREKELCYHVLSALMRLNTHLKETLESLLLRR